ncbi:MAG: ribosome biogenesis GTP-binding protein YihA/YsxC [bacterium]
MLTPRKRRPDADAESEPRGPYFEMSVVSIEGLPPEAAPEIALAGRSNVGKSSLINCVVARRGLAKTSSTPGKTQALNFFRFEDVRLVDLPGYGFARAPAKAKAEWSRLVERYVETRGALAALIVIVDARHPAFTDDRDMIDWARRREISFLVVATKADKLKRGALAANIARLRDEFGLGNAEGEAGAEPGTESAGTPDGIIAFSAETGAGKREVLSYLKRFKR